MTSEFVDGNRLELLCRGTEYFPALEAALAAAEREILLESYVYEDDASGARVTAALCAAAARGVAVHVLLDGFGARNLPTLLVARMRAAGITLLRYRPRVSPWTLKRHRLRRLHRKLVVVDGRVAFIGGINIIDDLRRVGRRPEALPARLDYMVRIEGPLLDTIRASAAQLWQRVAWSHSLRRPPPLPSIASAAPRGTQRAAFVQRDNLRHRDDIERAYLAAIDGAQHEIIIASAYFFPGARFRHALLDAARRGVRVVLLLQGRIEFVLLQYAARALYGPLLAAGVEIHEYRKAYLHAKVAVIDRDWATVGSSNIDPFSLWLAREANVVIEDAGFAARLRASLYEAMRDGARPVVPERWFPLPLWRRARVWICYGIVRVLMGMAGYADQL